MGLPPEALRRVEVTVGRAGARPHYLSSMLVRAYLDKVNPKWGDSAASRTWAINRLRRAGTDLDQEIPAGMSAFLAEVAGVGAVPPPPIRKIAAPVLGAGKQCPNCHAAMTTAVITDDLSSDYCVRCRIAITPE